MTCLKGGMGRWLWRGAAASAIALTVPAMASAQFTPNATAPRIASAASLGTAAIRGVDSAYDPVNRIFLVVHAYGPIDGFFVDTNGNKLDSVHIKSGSLGAGTDSTFPRVVYSPDVNGGAGGFLVVWAEEDSGLWTQVVTWGAGAGANHLIGAQQQISIPSDPSTRPWLEVGTLGAAYSQTSKVFLIVWRSYPSIVAPVRLRAAAAGLDGARIGSVQTLSSTFASNAAVTWDPANNEFGISFEIENDAGNIISYVFGVLPASNPTSGNFTRTTFGTFTGKGGMTDVAYNSITNHFVMAYNIQPSTGGQTWTAEFDASANLLGTGLLSTRLGSYDSLSIAYNPVSQTFATVGQDNTNDNVLGEELNKSGFGYAGVVLLTGSAHSNYNRVAADTDMPQWLATFAADTLQNVATQEFSTSTTNGGPAGTLGSASSTSTSSGSGSTSSTGCTTVQPGVGWTCVNGGWIPPSTTSSTSSGTTGGCTTVQPASGWTCVNGNWLPPTSGSTTTSTSSCTTAQPGTGWTCVNGNWLPPTSGSTSTSTSSCTTAQPGTGWTCVNGNWLPPGTGGTTSTSTSTSSCTTAQPGTGWTCVNGNWLPPGTGSTTSTSTSTSSCTTTQPGTGWTCVNGNWLPPGTGSTTSTSTSTSSCTTAQPGTGWTCLNGNWLPPGTGGTTSSSSTSSCTTPQPGTGWTCLNGNWLPPGTGGTTSSGSTSSCTTPQPGTGWTCLNGNWLPPGSGGTTSSGSTSSCTTTQPGSGWTCVNGNWLPPGTGSTSSTCSTVQPGTGWTCVNGNWQPPTMTSGCPSTPAPGPGWVWYNNGWIPPDNPLAPLGIVCG